MSRTDLPPGYPLAWPDGWDRTPLPKRERSKYSVTFSAAKDDVLSSLMKLGATRIALTSNIPLRLDGMPRADAREPADPGIAVWWIDRKTSAVRTIACDAWRTTRENMRAVGLALEALRAIERSKSTQILERAMASFDIAALPAGRPWFCEVLGLEHWPVSKEEIQAAYLARVRVVHPDAGGTHEGMIELGKARDEAESASK